MRTAGKWALLIAVIGITAGCAGEAPQQRPVGQRPAPVVAAPHVPQQAGAGLAGRTAAMLVSLFGQPGLDLTEGSARKLQFLNAQCVLDAYLYPQRGAEPIVTHLDARKPDGSDADRDRCIASLRRR
jgi:hypothetical protein